MSSPELPFVAGLSDMFKNLVVRYAAQKEYGHIDSILARYPQCQEKFRLWLQNPDCFLQHVKPFLVPIVQKNIRDKKWPTLKKLIDGTGSVNAIREFGDWAARNNYDTTDAMPRAHSEMNFGGPPLPYAPRYNYPLSPGGYNPTMSNQNSYSAHNIPRLPAYFNAYQKAGIPTYQQARPAFQQQLNSRCFKIPSSVVGLMVGAGGSNLAPIQQMYGVRVNYPRGKHNIDANIFVQGPTDEQVLSACLAIMDKTSNKTMHKTVLVDSSVLNGVRSMNDERMFDFCKVHVAFVAIKMQTMEIRAHSKQSLADAQKALEDEFGNTPSSPANAKKKQTNKKKNKENFVRPPVVLQPKSPSTFAYLKEHTNILLLGVSGVGKSTFLNAIANYFAFGQDYNRAERECTVTIPTDFSKYDDQHNVYKIKLRPPGSNEDGANEHHAEGESATQEPRCYTFKFNVQGKNKYIRIIDTPGLIDTNGVIKDQENMKNILSYLTHFQTIQAVCILSKPSEARLSPPNRYYMTELLSKLHKDAAANIIFLFPHARGSNYRPGEARIILEQLLKEIKAGYNVEIPLNDQTIFCFDNDGYRYIAARKYGNLPETNEMASAKEIWNHTSKETERLIQQISKLPDYEIGKTLAIQNARNTLIALARPLADLSRKQLNSKKSIDDKIEEIERLKKEGIDLTDKLHFEIDVYGKVAVATPRVVCNQCAQPIGNGLNIPKVCHNNCECVDANVLAFDPRVEMCTVFAEKHGICEECGCAWNVHQRVDYDVTSYSNKAINVVVQAGLDNKNAQAQAAEEFISRLKEEDKKQDETIRMIKQHSAAFAIFVRQHSLVACNDAFLAYVNQCIQDEEAKFGTVDEDKKRRDKLKLFREQYQQELDLYNTQNAAGSQLTLENIREKLQELLNNPDIGQYLSELKSYLEVSTDGELQHERCQQMETLFGKMTVA